MSSEGDIALKIAGEEAVTIDVTKGQEIDLKHRDPEHLHDEIRIRFEDVFGEPDESVYSFDCVWTWSFKFFTGSKLWCYRIMSLLCGIPAAIYWGCYFAVLSFCAIWCCEPYMKAYAIELNCFRKIFETLLNAFYRPCLEACGYVFYNIRIRKE